MKDFLVNLIVKRMCVKSYGDYLDDVVQLYMTENKFKFINEDNETNDN